MSEVAENYFKKLGSMLDTEMEAARLDREISKEAAQ